MVETAAPIDSQAQPTRRGTAGAFTRPACHRVAPDASLDGLRLLVVRPYTTDGKPSAETMIAADPIGAGEGERVLVVHGRAARHAIGKGHDIGFQTAVVGIIDKMELSDGRVVGPHVDFDEG